MSIQLSHWTLSSTPRNCTSTREYCRTRPLFSALLFFSEVDLLILQQRDCYAASVHETRGDKPVCAEPKTLFPHDECGWDYIDDTSGKLLNNTLVEKARAEEISVIRELGVWEVVDRPRDEVVFGTRWVDINKG